MIVWRLDYELLYSEGQFHSLSLKFLFLLDKEQKVTEDGAFLYIEFFIVLLLSFSISQGTYFALNICGMVLKSRSPFINCIKLEGLNFVSCL